MDSEQWDFRRDYRILVTRHIHLNGLNALDVQILRNIFAIKY